MPSRTAVAGLVLVALAAAGLCATVPAAAAPRTAPGAAPVTAPGAAPARTPLASAAGGTYVPVAPTRVLDSGRHVGVTTTTPVGAARAVTVTVAGAGHPVPNGAAAVVLNVTAAAGTRSGYVSVYAGGSGRPSASALSYPAGRSVANLVVAPLGANGTVTLYNGSAGSVRLLADVSGYYTGGAVGPAQQGAFGRVVPARVLDTGAGIGVGTSTPVQPRSTVTFAVEGTQGVPTDVAAVALNITATGGSTGGYVTAYASQSTRPATSNLIYPKAQAVAALSVVRTGGDGKVTFYNGSAGTVRLAADVQGYYTAGDPLSAGDLAALPPARVLPASTVGAGKTVTVHLAGAQGVPVANVATALLTVTATGATRSGALTVYQGARRPPVSSLTYAAGIAATNLVAAPVSPAGTVTIYNDSTGSVQVYADIAGYAPSADLPYPGVSTAHYVRGVSAAQGGFADSGQTGVGCADAQAGDSFVLLHIGAQLNDMSGVQLSATSTNVAYDDLVTALDAYVTSYRACSQNAVTIAVATNNSGDFTAYPPAARGSDWADRVIDVITPRAGVTIMGADDIEGAFSSTQDEALAWEAAFLGATDKRLLFTGSLDGCPSTYAPSGADCAFGWTQAKYVALTHSGTRVDALPQVYTAAQARQWANVFRTSKGTITFAGSLTENSSGCSDLCGMVPPQGWAFLYHGLATVVPAPPLPAAADLDIVS